MSGIKKAEFDPKKKTRRSSQAGTERVQKLRCEYMECGDKKIRQPRHSPQRGEPPHGGGSSTTQILQGAPRDTPNRAGVFSQALPPWENVKEVDPENLVFLDEMGVLLG